MPYLKKLNILVLLFCFLSVHILGDTSKGMIPVPREELSSLLSSMKILETQLTRELKTSLKLKLVLEKLKLKETVSSNKLTLLEKELKESLTKLDNLKLTVQELQEQLQKLKNTPVELKKALGRISGKVLVLEVTLNDCYKRIDFLETVTAVSIVTNFILLVVTILLIIF